MKGKPLVLSLLAIMVMGGVAFAQGQQTGSDTPAGTTKYLPSGPSFKDVVVATVEDSSVGHYVLRTNIYLPSTITPGPAPLLLYIHGHQGAYNFANGSRAYELSIALKNRGIAVATTDYRPGGTGLDDTFDLKAYVRYFRAHATEYNIDPHRIGVWGTSRGGHLAAMLETTGNVKALDGNVGDNLDVSSSVACAAIYYPIVDILMAPNGGVPSWFVGSKENLSAKELVRVRDAHDTSSPLWKYVQLIEKINPINYVTKDDPPVLIAVSAKDPVVGISPSWALFNKFVENGVDASFYAWGHGTHGVVGPDIEAATQEWLVRKLTGAK